MNIAELKKAIVLEPENLELRLKLASAFAEEGKLSDAMKQLHRALQLNADHPGAMALHTELTARVAAKPDNWWGAAVDHAKHWRFDDAVLFGRAAVDRESPDDHKRWVDLAVWCANAQLNERALLAYGRALGITQQDPRIVADRDQLLHKLGESDSVDLFSEAPLGPLHDAIELLVDGDVIGAKRVLAMASPEVQSSACFHRVRGEIWKSEGEEARARKAFDRANELDSRPFRAGRLAKLIDNRRPGRIGTLSWTAYGGGVSPLEAVAVVGDGELKFTGNVGEKIRDSCSVAYTCLKVAAPSLGIDGLVRGMDLHLNFANVESPIEGFSAGLALTLAGLSALRQQPLYPRLATTGAITLHGDVLRIAGVYEKGVAARLHGVRRVLYPRGNIADVKSLPKLVTEKVEFIAVSSLSEALEHAFA